jgi:hypothetical protein
MVISITILLFDDLDHDVLSERHRTMIFFEYDLCGMDLILPAKEGGCYSGRRTFT